MVVMHGGAVVASYTINGNAMLPRHKIAVAEGYRRRGLGAWMMFEWSKRTMRPRVLAPQEMNQAAVGLFVAAQVAVTRWAIEGGRSVPAAVQAALGPDSDYLVGLAAQVEASGETVVVRP